MKWVLLVLCCIALAAGCGASRHAARVLAEQFDAALPEGWSIVSVDESSSPGREGIHIFAENADIRLRDSKAQHASMGLYFRPKSVETHDEGWLFHQPEQGPYSRHLGSTEKYEVYCGGTGTLPDDRVVSAMKLRRPQNK